jgi:hypothetical protein
MFLSNSIYLHPTQSLVKYLIRCRNRTSLYTGDGEPGVQTIWRGMQDVRASAITIQYCAKRIRRPQRRRYLVKSAKKGLVYKPMSYGTVHNDIHQEAAFKKSGRACRRRCRLSQTGQPGANQQADDIAVAVHHRQPEAAPVLCGFYACAPLFSWIALIAPCHSGRYRGINLLCALPKTSFNLYNTRSGKSPRACPQRPKKRPSPIEARKYRPPKSII